MRRIVNLHPARGGALTLGALPFVLLVFAYLIASSIRLEANPDDKLLPSFASIAAAVQGYAFEEDARSGEILLWKDTFASLKRIGTALWQRPTDSRSIRPVRPSMCMNAPVTKS